MSIDLRERLQALLLPAMRAGDKDTVTVVRSALAAIANAEAIPTSTARPEVSGPVAGAVTGLAATEALRRELTAAEVQEIVESESHERLHAADEAEAGGLGTYAARLRSQAAVLAHLLEIT